MYIDLFPPTTISPMGHLQTKICCVCVCGRKWWVITLPPISYLTHPSTQIRGDLLIFCAYAKHDEWLVVFVAYRQVYDFLWDFTGGSAPLVGLIRCFLNIDWVCCVNVHVYPQLSIDELTSQAAYNKHSVITVTWESCAASTYTAGPHASAETQITLFYYLPVRIIYGVITELHNESGWLFKF